MDIGQGDATFITFPDDTQMLIDCSIDARILEALGRVMPYYDRTIDYLVITHPDMDHFGGCEDVLERFDVAHIVYTGVSKDGVQRWQSYLEAQTKEEAVYIEIDHQERWSIASSTLFFLYPDHSVKEQVRVPGFEKDTGVNNTSITFVLEYEGTSLLLAGDIEEELELYLVNTYSELLDIDILKVGHHGSPGSSSHIFLETTSPQDAIISSGKGNKYGHPSPRVLKRLERVSSTIWRTDEKGDILVSITPQHAYYVGPYLSSSH